MKTKRIGTILACALSGVIVAFLLHWLPNAIASSRVTPSCPEKKPKMVKKFWQCGSTGSRIASTPRADILVVDDMPDNIRLLSKILLEQGYSVRKALNGQIALTAAPLLPPDLILLDINMPEMNGYEVCKILKSNAPTHSIPVIFLSALDEVFDKFQAFQVGGVDFITKPFYFEEVLSRSARKNQTM